ncbi:MAG: RagB/SusD family nutrient uptake outer membrane protein, partial [Bacteroidales bacterium]|nr:RagB/SusD family nutrient uptake outer membrane protein [Bacteroidales bacterium]
GFVSADKLSELITKLEAGNYEVKVKGAITQDIINAAGDALRKRYNELAPETPSSKSLSKAGEETNLVFSVFLDLTKTTGLTKIEGSVSEDGLSFTGLAGCKALVRIAFPETLTEIGKTALSRCINLVKVMLAKPVGTIAEDAFYSSPVTLNINGVDNPVLDEADALSSLAALYYRTHQNHVFMGEITGYNYGPHFALTNFQDPDVYMSGSGDGDCMGEREFSDFSFKSDNQVALAGYVMLCRPINESTQLIEGFKWMSELTPTMKRVIAEARVIRAYAHMMLGIYYGAVPITDRVATADNPLTNAESRDAVMQWVADEIDAALPDLDERKSTGDKEGALKITKGFANAVKGKALLWKGDYNGAKAALKEVISSGKYALLKNINDVGHFAGNASSESVFEFEVKADGSSPNTWNTAACFNWRLDFFAGRLANLPLGAGWGWINTTAAFSEALIQNDGKNSDRRKAWIKTYDELLYDFAWISDEGNFTPGKTSFKTNDKNRGVGYQSYFGNEGYFIWKTNPHDDSDINNTGMSSFGQYSWNYSVMRYAEVLLLYAEACAQTGDNDGLQYLNQIQRRAGSAHISSSLTLKEVQNEKRFELWLEGSHSADLIRWGKTEDLEKKDWTIPVLRDRINDGYGNQHAGYVDYTAYDQDTFKNRGAGFKQGKNELLPFPSQETLAKYGIYHNLRQNPGW